MKILLTCHQFFPRCYHGTERYTLDLAHSLQSLGHDVAVLTTSRHPDDSQNTPWIDYAFEGVAVVAVDLARNAGAGFGASYDRPDLDGVYGDILCREKPDVIHCCHLLYLGAGFLSVAACAGVPIVMTLTDFFGICWTNRLQTCQNQSCAGPDPDDLNCVQDMLLNVRHPFRIPGLDFLFRQLLASRRIAAFLRDPIRRGRLPSKALQSALVNVEHRRPCLAKGYRLVDRFIAPTDYLKQAHVQAGFSSSSIDMLRFGIGQPTAVEKTQLRDRYVSLAAGARRPVIGFIGQIAKHKGILHLLNAFSGGLSPQNILRIYGDLDQSPAVSKVVIARAAANPDIQLAGTFPASEIYSRLAEIDILVLPSTWAENSPLVLLNALASLTMVVVSDVEGMTELVVDGVNGRRCKPGDDTDLRRVLGELVAKPAALLDWSENAPSPYATSPLDYAKTIERCYRELASSRPARGCYDRERFPTRQTPPVSITCTPCEPPQRPLGEHTLSGWRSQKSEGVEAVADDEGITLHLRTKTASLFIDPFFQKSQATCIEYDACWPHDGITAFYYATQRDPSLDESRKATIAVSGGEWHRLRIMTNPHTSPVTALRWTPLHDAKGARVQVSDVRPASSSIALPILS